MSSQREGSHGLGETKPTDTWILDFWPPELWEINLCCLSLPVCVTAALANKYRKNKTMEDTPDSS